MSHRYFSMTVMVFTLGTNGYRRHLHVMSNAEERHTLRGRLKNVEEPIQRNARGQLMRRETVSLAAIGENLRGFASPKA